MTLLAIDRLTVEYPSRNGVFTAVSGASFSVAAGEILGVVGESGAGKSTVGTAVMGLLSAPGRIGAGSIRYRGQELVGLPAEDIRRLRGRHIGMIFQDPSTALNPLLTVGRQLIETIRLHHGLDDDAARARALALMADVGIPDPESRLGVYPHQLSGGLRQRVVIAIVLSGDPDLIIADEPTTALDVSIQAQILDLIRAICRDRGVGVLLVTHDMGVISEVADRVAVMSRGEVVETGATRALIDRPQAPYTRRLISAVPRTDRRLRRFVLVQAADAGGLPPSDTITSWFGRGGVASPAEGPLIEVRGLHVSFVARKALLKRNRVMLPAVRDVSFDVASGEVLGLVGESGSGKSTVARAITGLIAPDGGAVRFAGIDLSDPARRSEARALRLGMQMIFQDPFGSLNPRMRVGEIIAEPILYHRLAGREEAWAIVNDLLDRVGLGRAAAAKMPHQFSGGQRQRIGIARALATRPRFLVCDEPTSSLDVSIQAQILNLLKELQESLGLTMLFISHNLAVIRQMCDRVAVMRAGEVCELADTESLFSRPQHSYTAELLRLMPKFETRMDAEALP